MTAGSIDKQLENLDKNHPEYFDNVQKAVEDHGIEALFVKLLAQKP